IFFYGQTCPTVSFRRACPTMSFRRACPTLPFRRVEFAVEHIGWSQPNCYGSFHNSCFVQDVKNDIGCVKLLTTEFPQLNATAELPRLSSRGNMVIFLIQMLQC